MIINNLLERGAASVLFLVKLSIKEKLLGERRAAGDTLVTILIKRITSVSLTKDAIDYYRMQ